MTTPNSDLGSTLADNILCSITDMFGQQKLDQPASVFQSAGTSLPNLDPCQGMLWCRLMSVYPTMGDGAPFAGLRADFDIPAWMFQFEVGVLWCHPVINEDGTGPEPAEWTAYACRDGQYRMAIAMAFQTLLPDRIKSCAGGMSIDPWQPVGPDGGYSGGVFVVRIVSPYLAYS